MDIRGVTLVAGSPRYGAVSGPESFNCTELLHEPLTLAFLHIGKQSVTIWEHLARAPHILCERGKSPLIHLGKDVN